VVDDGRLIGVVSGRDVARAVEVAQARGLPEPPRTRRRGLLVWAAVTLIMFLAAGLLYTPPVAVIAPGESLDISHDFEIAGVPTHPVSGRYLLTSVRLEQPNGLELLAALVRSDRDVVPLGEVVPPGVDPGQAVRQQQAVFKESQQLAAAAAARAAGLPVEVGGSGARVEGVLRASPATGALRPGDVIVAVDGEQIRSVSDFRDAVRSSPPGTPFRLTVERRGQAQDVPVRSARLPLLDNGVGIGVALSTRDATIRLPFNVQFKNRSIGGPSAGLAYALAITDALDPTDDAHGRSIAATGTINPDGQVGPVGGVAEKAIAARHAGAGVLLVPSEEVRDVTAGGLQVRGVSSLMQALQMLRTTA
jgi:PDZ domain-containing protein